MAAFADIQSALFAKVATANTGSPDLPISWPDIAFDPGVSATDGKYLAVSFFSNRPRWEGLAAGRLDQGLLQVDVVWPSGSGTIAPAAIADLIIAHFALGTQMTSGTANVKVTSQPWATTLIEPDKTRAIVTIPWTA